jgi:alpha-1,2-mannosyltransferase
MGGSRDAADEARLSKLRELARELGIHSNVEIVVNAPYHEIVRRLGEASVGLNTMQDEHFGINVVEFMVSTAGLLACRLS